jgi:hypothetical protein
VVVSVCAGVGVSVAVSDAVGDGMGVSVAIGDGMGVSVAIGDGVGVSVAIGDGVGVSAAVGVVDGVLVTCWVGVGTGVPFVTGVDFTGVGTRVGVRVGVGARADGLSVGTGGSGVGVACGPSASFVSTVPTVVSTVGSGTRRTVDLSVDEKTDGAMLASATQASKTVSAANSMMISEARESRRVGPPGFGTPLAWPPVLVDGLVMCGTFHGTDAKRRTRGLPFLTGTGSG